MRTEYEIRRRINTLIDEMYELSNTNDDLFTHMTNMKKSVNNYEEIKHIYWILDEPVPKILKSLIKC